MRSVGLDVHRDFCEVAIWDGAQIERHPRVPARRGELEAFARSLRRTDQVALEATGNAHRIAEVLRPHVRRVVIANGAALQGVGLARAKTDRLDAKSLAQLLAGGLLPTIWVGDEATRLARRRVSRREHLVRQRTQFKNQVHAALHRNLAERPPMTDLFGVGGRRWLAGQHLPADELDTIDACLRQIDFLTVEIARLDTEIAAEGVASPEVRRLLTVPGVNLTTAAAFMAAVGDISRFPSPRHLVAYLGLDPRVSQSGTAPARHGKISKQGSTTARHALVEAAWVVARAPGPMRAFARRVAARRGTNVAAVAVARKLVVLFWHMLTNGEDYAYGRPSLTAEKLRRAALVAGAPSTKGKRSGGRVYATTAQRRAELAFAAQAEHAYRHTVERFTTKPTPPARTT